jgi:hypothetical protein
MAKGKSRTEAIRMIELIRDRFEVDLFTGPRVDGIEVTQAIQYYKSSEHLTDPKDRGTDNAAGLVARKPAYVRVYVRPGLFAALPHVTGELRIERRLDALGLSWQTLTTLTPLWPGQITATNANDYVTERSTLRATLNFIITTADMSGHLRLTARVWRAETPGTVDEQSTIVNVTLLQTLTLRGIVVRYNGDDGSGKNNITLTAPTLADLQATAAWTLTVDPLQSTASFALGGSIPWSTPLTGVATQPGGCSVEWLALNVAIVNARTLDGNRSNAIYYGLLPPGIPMKNVFGCATGGVSSGPAGAQVTMAHEIGHKAGLNHAPCGTPSGDPNYPAYEPYDAEPLTVPGPLGSTGTIQADRRTGRIGEFGLNINNGVILPPASNDDYMSYCNQNWISLFHHDQLIFNSKFDPWFVGMSTFVPPDLVDPFLPPWEIKPDPGPAWEPDGWRSRQPRATELISVVGIITDAREIEVTDVMRVSALPQIESARETPFTIEMLDGSQKVIARAPIMRLLSQGCGCRCGGGHDDQRNDERHAYVFQSLMPIAGEGAMLRITRPAAAEEGEPIEVWSRHAPKNPPRIVRFDVHVRERAGYARWDIANAVGESLTCTLQFSKDGGRSWNGLASGLVGTEYEFNLSALPSGDVVFALMAHDGFHSSRSISDPIPLPPRAPVVAVMHPFNGDTLREGQPLRLWASATTGSSRPVLDRLCRWTLDGQDIGHGLEIWITTPGAGEHRCSVSVEEDGHRAEAHAAFVVAESHNNPLQKTQRSEESQ